MKDYVKLCIAILIAGVAHALLFVLPSVLNHNLKQGGGQPPSKAVKLRIVEKQDLPDIKKFKPKENKPQRLSSNDEKLKENKGTPKSKSEPPTQKKKLKETDIKNPVLQKKNIKKAQYVSAKTLEQKKKENSIEPVTLQKTVEKLSKEKTQVIESSMSESSYKRFLMSMKVGRMKGKPTPRLIVAFHDIAQILAVHKYFGMKVIALDPKHARKVVEVTGLGTDSVDYQLITNFNWKNYSSRIFPRTEAFFQKYKRAILNKNMISGNLRLVSITPNGPDSYYRYKQLEVIKQNGFEEKNVSSVIARFYKTSFGSWALGIEKLKLKTGLIKTLSDFELKRLKR